MVRHDSILWCLEQLCGRHADQHPQLEQVVPEPARHVASQGGQARLDVVAHSGARSLLIRVIVVSLLAAGAPFRMACSRRDGDAAR